MVHPNNSTNTATAWKKSRFTLSERLDFYVIDLSIAVYAFPMCMLTSLLVSEILLLRYVNMSTNFRGLLVKGEIAPSCLKHMNSILSSYT